MPGHNASNTALESSNDDPEQAKIQLDAVVVPVSGGGLIGGIATAVKALAPNCKACSIA